MAGAGWYESHDQIPKEELQFLKRTQMEVLMPPVQVMTPDALQDTVIGRLAARAGKTICINVMKPDGSPVDNLPVFLKTFKLQVRYTDPANIHDDAHSMACKMNVPQFGTVHGRQNTTFSGTPF